MSLCAKFRKNAAKIGQRENFPIYGISSNSGTKRKPLRPSLLFLNVNYEKNRKGTMFLKIASIV